MRPLAAGLLLSWHAALGLPTAAQDEPPAEVQGPVAQEDPSSIVRAISVRGAQRNSLLPLRGE